MDDAFVHALQGGMRLGAAVVLVGAFVAAATISSRRRVPANAAETAETADAAPAELAA
jgi:hypothetical protein